MSPKVRGVLERLADHFSQPHPASIFLAQTGREAHRDRVARSPRAYRRSESRGYSLPGPSDGSHRVGADRGFQPPTRCLQKHLGLSVVRPTSRVRLWKVKLPGVDQPLTSALVESTLNPPVLSAFMA